MTRDETWSSSPALCRGHRASRGERGPVAADGDVSLLATVYNLHVFAEHMCQQCPYHSHAETNRVNSFLLLVLFSKPVTFWSQGCFFNYQPGPTSENTTQGQSKQSLPLLILLNSSETDRLSPQGLILNTAGGQTLYCSFIIPTAGSSVYVSVRYV